LPVIGLWANVYQSKRSDESFTDTTGAQMSIKEAAARAFFLLIVAGMLIFLGFCLMNAMQGLKGLIDEHHVGGSFYDTP
jgi:hypothetical protein